MQMDIQQLRMTGQNRTAKAVAFSIEMLKSVTRQQIIQMIRKMLYAHKNHI